MSRLDFGQQVPAKYEPQIFSRIVRAICGQVNQLAEGQIAGRYAAQASVPSGTAVAFNTSDIIWDSNATVTGGTIRLGWICTAPGTGATATLSEIRAGVTGGGGTVTNVTVVTNAGVSGSVTNSSTTPAISISLGAITPTSIAATGNVTGLNLSGTNTGDQTSVSGNAGTASALQTARTIGGVSFDGTANITVLSATGGFTVSGGNFVSRGISDSATAVALSLGGAGANSVAIANSASNPSIKTSAGSLLLGGANGIVGIKITDVASAGNYLEVISRASGTPVNVYATSDAGMAFGCGTGQSVTFYSNLASSPAPQLQVVHTASTTNYVTVTGSNGGNPIIGVSGGQLSFNGTTVIAGGTIRTNVAGELIGTGTTLTDGAGASAGTLTNAPSAGNPTKWIQINDNGTTRKIPTWT